jgi:group I intron endonuclease
MPKRNDNRTIDSIREQNAAAQRKFYYTHLDSERKRKRDYARGKAAKKGFVYLITNLINSKKYIGITTRNINLRFREHIWDAGKRNKITILRRAIAKYGSDNFRIEMVEELTNVTEEQLHSRETYYIEKYNTFIDDGGGYNMVKVGKERLIISDASRKRMSENQIGEKNHFYGRKHSDSTKVKMSDNHANILGVMNPFYGKTHSVAARKEISIGNKEYLKTHPHSRTGKLLSDESRRKISSSLTGIAVGNRNPAYDVRIFSFRNVVTDETFRGTGFDLIQKYNLNAGCVSELKRGTRKWHKSWIIEKSI